MNEPADINAGAEGSPAGAPDDAWWRGSVIYQIYPRSFLDTNDDGVGDLAGCLAGLDHVASIGVDACSTTISARQPGPRVTWALVSLSLWILRIAIL